MQYISVGRRALAIIIDGFVLIPAFVLGAILFPDSAICASTDLPGGGFSVNCSMDGPAVLVPLLIGFAYFIILEATAGATVGKFIVGIRVRQLDGTPITWKQSTIRNLLRIIDGLFFYLVGAIIVWNSTPLRQRLGDQTAHTVVIQRGSDVAATYSGAPAAPPALPTDPPG
ncbi:MAG: RDD family protein [Actinomycetota bacterium]